MEQKKLHIRTLLPSCSRYGVSNSLRPAETSFLQAQNGTSFKGTPM